MKAHRQGIVCLWAFCVHIRNFAKMRKSSILHFFEQICLLTLLAFKRCCGCDSIASIIQSADFINIILCP